MDEIVTVREDEIASAILALMEVQKTVAEGAGATPVAACMFKKVDTTAGKTVCVVSGGNVDVTTLSRVITKGLSKAGVWWRSPPRSWISPADCCSFCR